MIDADGLAPDQRYVISDVSCYNLRKAKTLILAKT